MAEILRIRDITSGHGRHLANPGYHFRAWQTSCKSGIAFRSVASILQIEEASASAHGNHPVNADLDILSIGVSLGLTQKSTVVGQDICQPSGIGVLLQNANGALV
jgi:hypothetical protein